MSSLTSISTARILRRVSAEAIAHFAATDAQAARLIGVGHYPGDNATGRIAPLWDAGLLDRLSLPLSRVRE